MIAPANGPLVYVGSKWTTRDAIPRRVTVLKVDHGRGSATVQDDDQAEPWIVPVETIERSWTRRSSSSRLRAAR